MHNMLKKLTQRFNDLKFRYKIIILTLISAMLPMVIVICYMQSEMTDILRERETDAMERSVGQAVDSLENQAETYENLINYLSYSKDLRDVLSQNTENDYDTYLRYTESLDPLLETPQIYHQEMKGITIYSNNIEVAHGTTFVPLEEIEKEPWSSGLTDTTLLEWSVKRGANKEIVATRRLYGENDLTAIVAVRLDYDAVLEPFAGILSDNTGGLVCDENGNVIYADYSMDEKYRPEDGESLEYIRDNYVCVEREMEDTGWTFCMYRPEEVLIRSARTLSMRNIPIIVLCVALLAIFSVVFSRRLVSKLELLTKNMNEVQFGVRRVTVHDDSKDEVGTLVRAFSRMMDELNRLISEVYEAKIKLQDTELRALQAQINPHFLYNSLSIINWKAIETGQDEISRVTLDLSVFYRTSLNHGETMTTVENEINNIRAYLRIQLVMHDDSFSVEEDVDEAVFPCRTPKLILQPLVENAIDHGLDPLEQEDKVLRISAKKDGDMIELRVEDNGNGMPKETARKILSYQSPGYGVHNVYERIKLIYKEEGSMEIHSTEGEGTRVVIRIPASKR